MQVRKFEAKSMKEALEMVKTQMGPDAIILSAKDNSRGFGLVGQMSVEITAAVSEETLQRKRFVESRIRPQDKERIQKSPARVQRQFIDNMVDKYMEDSVPKKQITRTRYIDIDDQEAAMSLGSDSAGERIKSAAQRAWNAMQTGQPYEEETTQPIAPVNARGEDVYTRTAARTSGGVSVTQAAKTTEPVVETNAEIKSLRQELAQLKSVLNNFQKVPQSMVGQHPGAEYGLPYELSAMFEKLLQAGVASEIVGPMLQEAQKQMPPIRFKSKALIEGWVAKHILDTTKIVGDTQGTKIQIFMGPSGSGKTASLVKMASHYVVNAHKKVAMITTDTMKVGAADQLRIYAQILNVPFAIVRTSQDWDYVVKQLSGYDYILCDCPGMSLKSIEEIQFLKGTLPKSGADVTHHLVLNATAKDQDLTEMGRRYQSIQFNDVIFTTLDDSNQHGAIYNFAQRFEAPLHSFGLGSRVPEDFELATRERVLDLIFKLTKVNKQVNT
jgi:flagellar biosynthesis protein FlhF